LLTYLEGIKQNVKGSGKPLARQKNEAGHFTWLAEFQVNRKTMAEIAGQCGADRSTVSEAIHGLAELLKLPLRNPKRGKSG
jgi:hypothetical protein